LSIIRTHAPVASSLQPAASIEDDPWRSTMRKLEPAVLALSIPCLLVAGGAGCGDSATAQARLDGAVDTRPADAPGDSATADAPWGAEAAKLDLAKLDAPSIEDAAQPDAASDASQTRLDVGAVDAVARDVPGIDASGVIDAERSETAGVDGAAGVDALALTTATITFRLENRGAQSVYLRSECFIPFDVTCAADGTVYTNTTFCACNCADSSCNGAVACGPCAPTSGVAIEAGKTRDLTWISRASTLQTKSSSTGPFQCVAHVPIPTGEYRLSISVYPTAADAVAGTNGTTVRQSFSLDTANTTVAVPIP
jgi:hypothetical protein